MTIKELAALLGVSQQSVYKRLRNHGIKLNSLKNKETGAITADGLQAIKTVFGVDLTGSKQPEQAPETSNESETEVENGVESEVERLKAEVEKLASEVERLNNQNSTLVEKVESLESERDYLRQTLQQQQQLTALTLQRVPVLPAAGETSRPGLFGWLRRKQAKGGTGNGNE